MEKNLRNIRQTDENGWSQLGFKKLIHSWFILELIYLEYEKKKELK